MTLREGVGQRFAFAHPTEIVMRGVGATDYRLKGAKP
jgi:hypothetical protein